MTAPRDNASAKNSNRQFSPWCLPLFLFDVAAFLYLQLFIFPHTPIFLANDTLIFLQDAQAMVQGRALYRDIFQFTFPGTQVVYAVLIKALGPRIWFPNAVLVLMGTLAAWLTTLISKRVIKGPSAFVPAFLLISFEFSAWHVATHHWFSALAATTAILIALEKRNVGRIVAAGAFCGLSAWFTQTEGTSLVVGLGIFILWENRRGMETWRAVVMKWGLLLAGFIPVLAIGLGYFIWKAGPKEFVWSALVFPLKYFPAWAANNSYRVYFSDLLGLRMWEVIPLLFVYAAIPWVYVFFTLTYMQRAHVAPFKPWDRLMLLNIAGFFLFLSVASAPGWFRLCTISPPAWILLIWLVRDSSRRFSRAALAFLCVAAVLCAATATVKTIRHEQLLRADLNLPTGRAAFLDTGPYDEFRWLAARTSPSDFFFGGRNPHFYFPLGLRPPSRVPTVVPNDYTRPRDVGDLIAGLESHRVRFVLWQTELNPPSDRSAGGDHLGPLRAYLRQHYHVAKVFPGSQDHLWERNDE